MGKMVEEASQFVVAQTSATVVEGDGTVAGVLVANAVDLSGQRHFSIVQTHFSIVSFIGN